MRLIFTPLGWEDYRYWQATDKATLKRVNFFRRDQVVCLGPFLTAPNTNIGDASLVIRSHDASCRRCLSR